MAAELGIAEGDDVSYFERVRYADGEPLAIMTNSIPVSVAKLDRESLEKHGLYNLLRAAGSEPRIATQVIGARIATAADARILQERRGAALLTMTRTAFDAMGRVVDFGTRTCIARTGTPSNSPCRAVDASDRPLWQDPCAWPHAGSSSSAVVSLATTRPGRCAGSYATRPRSWSSIRRDYFLYLPLLPEVSGGVLDPRRVTVSIPGTLPKVRLVLGSAEIGRRRSSLVGYVDPEGRPSTLDYDQLLLTTGSVNKLLPIPGVAQHAHGFRDIAEALFLRDHITLQLELADSTDDPAERDARLTFVVVGAGYTGTEVAAQGALMTAELARDHPRLAGHQPRWLLIDTADRVLPGLGESLARTADRVLRHRGVDVRTRTSVAEATADAVRLSDGTVCPTRSLIWCVGVRPEPLVSASASRPTGAGWSWTSSWPSLGSPISGPAETSPRSPI